jgi:hypothetical protein
MRIRAVTLIELLVAIAMTVVIIGALTRAYVVSLDYDSKIRTSRDQDDRYRLFEDKVTGLLQNAYLSADATDSTSYFIAGDPAGNQGSGPVDIVTFTTTSSRIPGSVLESTADWESLNDSVGPQGGVSEISVSTTAVGDPGDKQGLFERQQTPSDGDPTQGGKESVLNPDVSQIQFQFFDGLEWTDAWDTRQGQRRLPAAVQVTYSLNGDDNQRSFIVRLPLSDVTPDNPLQTEATG